MEKWKVNNLRNLDINNMIPTLVHYKQTILDRIKLKPDPNNRHIRQWTDTNIEPNRLIKDMQREGYIRIKHEWHGGTCKRMLIGLVDHIVEPQN